MTPISCRSCKVKPVKASKATLLSSMGISAATWPTARLSQQIYVLKAERRRLKQNKHAHVPSLFQTGGTKMLSNHATRALNNAKWMLLPHTSFKFESVSAHFSGRPLKSTEVSGGLRPKTGHPCTVSHSLANRGRHKDKECHSPCEIKVGIASVLSELVNQSAFWSRSAIMKLEVACTGTLLLFVG